MADAELDSTENVDDDDNEDESSRHRRERRELQSKIQQLKKSVNKNDKTRKKKVDADIKALEDAFAKQWEHFNENTPVSTEDKSSEVCREFFHDVQYLFFISSLNMYHAKLAVKQIKINVKLNSMPIKK